MVYQVLDDAAFTVVQLEVTELADIKALRDTLREFAVFDEHAPPRVRAYAQEAATALNLLVLGAAPEPEKALQAASTAIDRAIAEAGQAGAGDRADQRAAADAAKAEHPPGPARDSDPLPDDVDRELLRDFLTEARDGLTAAEQALLALESDPADQESINVVFRAFHTIKGTSAFMGLDQVAGFAHHAESLLSRVRDKELAYGQEVASLSLRSADLLRDLIDAVDTALAGDGRVRRPATYETLLHDLHHVDEIIAGARAIATTPAAARRDAAAESADGAAVTARKKEGGELSVRVRTDRLDRLIDLVGELVIAQSIIGGDDTIRSGANHELLKKVTHAGKIVRDLQDLSMSMRMVPLRTTFQKLTRVVRDVAVKAGKQVEFVTEGEDTELDRNMVDVVGDPLVHMVRNSVDHGIEPPADRAASGKDAVGRVVLRAYNQGGFVVVELRDDGRGLDRDRILAKAIANGLATPDTKYTDEQVFQFIFAPGFSTAAQVTDISGRGVGMDVVRRNIESVRGRVEIQSTLGTGTTFLIRLPLTLAVTDGMLVRVGSERYIVPITNIHMTFRPERGMLQTVGGRGEVVMLRGEVMPILRVHEVMGVTDAVTDPCDALLMVVADGDRRTALLVDELLGQQQVVAKALGEQLGTLPGIAGGAILGDGRVGIILDVAEMVAHARASGDFAAAA